MKNLNDKLSQALDIDPIEFEVVEPIVPTISNTEIVSTQMAVEQDAEFARKNIRNLIEKGTVAMDKLLNVADASEHPRAYEVAAGLIKNLADLNKDLLEIQKKKKDLSPQESTSSGKNVNVNNAVFVGSTAELVKLLKTNK